jgi:hypothetical protein
LPADPFPRDRLQIGLLAEHVLEQSPLGIAFDRRLAHRLVGSLSTDRISDAESEFCNRGSNTVR